MVARHRKREENAVVAGPKVGIDEAILGLHPPTESETIGTAKTTTPTPILTAAGLQGEGDVVVAATAIGTRTTNDFVFGYYMYHFRHCIDYSSFGYDSAFL